MEFNIYIDRLVGGRIEKIDEAIDPVVMQSDDNMLTFDQPVNISGKAYLAEDFLVINIDINTKYKAPCKICSEMLTTSFEATGVYLTEELTKVPAKVFDASGQIRDTIFLDIPDYHECEGGCPDERRVKRLFSFLGRRPD